MCFSTAFNCNGQDHIAKRGRFLVFSWFFPNIQHYKALLAGFMETAPGTVPASHRGTSSKHGQGVSCVWALKEKWEEILAFLLDSHQPENTKKKTPMKNPSETTKGNKTRCDSLFLDVCFLAV